jgi:hypothetical protein
VKNWTIEPRRKAANTDHNIQRIIVRTFAVFISVASSEICAHSQWSLITHIPTAHPSRQNTMDTVVDVGNHIELNLFNNKISAIITAKNMVITSINVKC